MCGICGFNYRDEALIQKMTQEMTHRGPDQEGIYCCDGASLGHRRLSIIDLSENGRQPMFNEDKSVCLVFNGEIYNFQSLRETLADKGHVFRSDSDSEVIVHGYEEYGRDMVHKLRGMFAFAIYDRNKDLLFLARDRIGIKPLYYHFSEGRLTFASEIKAILADRTIARHINHQAVYDYLGFEFVPAPETMFKDIYKLPAGYQLVLEKGRIHTAPYWEMSFAQDEGSPRQSYEEAVEQLREELEQAVKSHLISDVPLGVFLSGGLDSSAIVAMMRKHISGPLRTFTVGYEDKTFSELDYAQQVAEYFDTEHHVLMVDDLEVGHIEKSLWHLDEPMTDLSAIPLFLVCKKAREHVTVCLSGEGGDESLAGYDRFKAARFDAYLSKVVPKFVQRRTIGPLLERLPDQSQKKGLINILKRYMQGANLPGEGRHLRWQYFLDSTTTNQLFHDAFTNEVQFDPFRHLRAYAEKCDADDPVNTDIFLDMRFMMADSVLMKVDKMSMASSMEIRVPLLDHMFVESLARMPGAWKLKGFETKHIFRSALNGLLPDNIVNRGKQGYSLPVKNLLRTRLKDYMKEMLNDSEVINELMNVDYVNQLMGEHLEMRKNHNHVLWGLINIAVWHRRFFQNTPSTESA